MIPCILLAALSGAPEKDGLEARIQALIHESGAETAAVAFDSLETGRKIRINPHERFHAASTMKVPVMMAIFELAHEKRLRLDDPVPVVNDFISLADGSHFSTGAEDDADQEIYHRIGQTMSVRELMERMETLSSNLAINILIQRVTPERIMALMRSLGAPDMHVLRGVEDNRAYERGLNNTTTAGALLTLFRKLEERRVVSSVDSDAMVRILEGQQHRSGIPAGLPPGTRVANKTGWFTGTAHDAAIVFPPGRKPYVLVVLTRGIQDEARAWKLIAGISREVWRDEVRGER